MAHEAGKGDMYRSVDKKKFDENFDRIFSNHLKEHKDVHVELAEYELHKSTGEVIKKNVNT